MVCIPAKSKVASSPTSTFLFASTKLTCLSSQADSEGPVSEGLRPLTEEFVEMSVVSVHQSLRTLVFLLGYPWLIACGSGDEDLPSDCNGTDCTDERLAEGDDPGALARKPPRGSSGGSGSTASGASASLGGRSASTNSPVSNGAASSSVGGSSASVSNSTIGTSVASGGSTGANATSTGGVNATSAPNANGGRTATSVPIAKGGSSATTVPVAKGGSSATNTLVAKGGSATTTATLAVGGTSSATTSSGSGGLARITVSGTEFRAGTSRVWMNGCNTPWDAWNDFGGSYDHAFWDDHYSKLHAQGVNASRVWITCSGEVGINIDTSGAVSGATDAHWEDLDDFFKVAQSRGIYVMATLMSFDHFKDSYPTYQRWRNFINSDANVDSYINNYVIPFVKRYGDNPALWSIDLVNEPEWATTSEGSGTIEWSRFQSYFAKAAAAIHKNSQVLVTVGMAVIKYNSDAMDGNMISDAKLQAALPDPAAKLDFYSPHHYPWEIEYFGTPMYESPSSYFGEAQTKPCLIGESPANGSGATGRSLTEDFENALTNGWQGVLPWTSNGVDSNGGFDALVPATDAFRDKHSALVGP